MANILADQAGHIETAGNKLHDIVALLYAAEHRSMSASEWISLARVVRHALGEVKDSLCGECTYGDLVPTGTRIATLQREIRWLEKLHSKTATSELVL